MQLPQRPIRFVIVGAWNTLFGWLAYVGFYAVTSRLGISYLYATVPAQLLAIINAFILQRQLVFGPGATSVVGSFLRFSLVYWGFWAVNTPALAAIVTFAKLDPRVAQGILGLANAGLSYVIHDRFTFRQAAKPPP